MVEIPDITGDGINDVIGGTGYSINRVVLLNGSNGNEVWSIIQASAVEAVYPIKDIDRNGRHDILAGLRDGNILLIADGGSVDIKEESVVKIKYSMCFYYGRISKYRKFFKKWRKNNYEFIWYSREKRDIIKIKSKDLLSGFYFIELKGKKINKKYLLLKLSK